MLEGARGLGEHSRIHGAVNNASMRMPTKPIDRGLVNLVVVEYPSGRELLQVTDSLVNEMSGSVFGNPWVGNQCVITNTTAD